MRFTVPLAAAIVLAASVTAWGLGADHGTQPVGGTDKWPAGLRELVNTERRVHGYFVNWEDVFFAGDTDALNAFLAACGRLPDSEVALVIHPGKLEVKSPWDKEPRGIEADWRLHTTPFTRERIKEGKLEPGPFHVRVDVWLGERITLERIEVPANVRVESGGEIEAFVNKHSTTQPSGGNP